MEEEKEREGERERVGDGGGGEKKTQRKPWEKSYVGPQSYCNA